jgi:hypothetical protein
MSSGLSSAPTTRTSVWAPLLAWLAGPELAPDDEDVLSLCSPSSAAEADVETEADTDPEADTEGARSRTSAVVTIGRLSVSIVRGVVDEAWDSDTAC